MWNEVNVLTEEVLAKVIQRVAYATHSLGHTLEILVGLRADFKLENSFILENVEKAKFFKPEGLVKVARALGCEGVEELEIRLKLRKPTKVKAVVT